MILDNPTYIVMAVTPVSGDNRLFFGSQVNPAKQSIVTTNFDYLLL